MDSLINNWISKYHAKNVPFFSCNPLYGGYATTNFGKADYSWLKEFSTRLVNVGNIIKRLCVENALSFSNDKPFRPKSVLKYLVLVYYFTIYLFNIRKAFKNIIYFDPLASNGVAPIKFNNSIKLLPGSPILALVYTDKEKKSQRFDKLVFSDIDQSKIDELEHLVDILFEEKRIKHYSRDQILFKTCDVNEFLSRHADALDIENKKTHVLSFIDPYGLEVDWNTLENILSLNTDLIYTFMATGAMRAAESGINHDDKHDLKITRFMGDLDWVHLIKKPHDKNEIEQDLLALFLSKIASFRNLIVTYHVEGDSSFNYDVILATRKTGKKNSPWIRPMCKLKLDWEQEKFNEKRVIQALSGQITFDELVENKKRLTPTHKVLDDFVGDKNND